jgi:hypothetical protein
LSDMVDLMLDGMVCEECGAFLGEGVGHPRRCQACQASLGQGELSEEGEENEDTPFI